MIGGQVLDLASENKNIDLDTVMTIHMLKTGALIKASAELGAIVGGANEKQIKLASKFAENIGLAFQIVDDILDVCGDEKELGKPIGSDEQNKKTTFVTIKGIESAQKEVERLTTEATNILHELSYKDDFLFELSNFLCKRKS